MSPTDTHPSVARPRAAGPRPASGTPLPGLLTGLLWAIVLCAPAVPAHRASGEQGRCLAAHRGAGTGVAAQRTAAGGAWRHIQASDLLLHQAAAAGDTELLSYLLATGVDVDVRSDLDLSTPLHVAAQVGRPEVARRLIAHGADVGARSAGGFTPLHMAAWGGHTGIVDLLVSSGAEVDAPLGDRTTALNVAALEGHAATAARLLRAGADIEARGGHFNRTPVMSAASNGHADVVALLLRHGADTSVRDIEGRTAMDLALAGRWDNVVGLLRGRVAAD